MAVGTPVAMEQGGSPEPVRAAPGPGHRSLPGSLRVTLDGLIVTGSFGLPSLGAVQFGVPDAGLADRLDAP